MRIQTNITPTTSQHYMWPPIDNKFHKLYKKISHSFSAHASYQRISPRQWLCETFSSIVCFLAELLAPLSKTKLEEHPLLAVCDYLFSVFQATQLMIIKQSCNSILQILEHHTTHLQTRATLSFI